MQLRIETRFQEMLNRVSDQEKERNSALCRQTEKLRWLLSKLTKPEVAITPSREKRGSRNLISNAGEYALLK